MRKKISAIPFSGTARQEERLLAVIEKYKSDKSRLMTVMQEAQEIYGYLPFEVQKIISDGMDVPLEKIYGVATFYAQFALSPKGKYDVAVCLGTACYVKGAGKILEKFEKELDIKDGECTEDGKFSIDATRCVGACGLAPVISVGEDVYGKVTEDMVSEILANYM